ncbi:MAG: hypothetical protein GWM90_24795, partial [Gemmatimonadetes bacterium]|nr:hypothetical protein [Gemmatimonadota bacterium]NIQ57999.1 hypothetical protein [Gemmatimonadota bacterium]NIU78179.1 hypothetical protein [Gammaproteobacteria bacterium]NIX47175.1 hypothetical protein [Gemmatimonadota bacterium]
FLNPMNVDTTLDRVTPTLTREGPVAHVESPFPDEAFAGLDRTILGALLTEFGPDSFRRFWTSDDDVGSAFQAAFGLPAGDWVHRWVTERLGVVEAGPGVAGADVLLSLVALGLAAAVGALVYRRQEVGGA